ncbi:MAG: flavodoxin family protein [Chloroflexi bacterium]|nr:flavodoxin family protein [Chloroflexota bacterium]
MKVLGVVGSPRRERGLSHRIVTKVLEGANTAGAQTELLYLIDQKPQYCIHCGHSCFEDGECAQEAEATSRSRLVDAADALVVCAPVYCWQANGLTTAFFDKHRPSAGHWTRDRQHGRHALGIAVAGGTGSGVFTALQSIYAWMCLSKYRPLDPAPVTRFNLSDVLADAPGLGRTLAEAQPRPFADTAELMLTYDQLRFMDFGRIDEFRWLAEQIARGLEARQDAQTTVDTLQRLMAEATSKRTAGDARGEAECIMRTYRIGAAAW